MNKINVLDYSSKFSRTLFLHSDSISIFQNFPVLISGNTFEGGIFCNMDDDPELEIVFNTGYTVQALNLDRKCVPGWQKTVFTYALEGAPAFDDIEGDGFGEIVVTNNGLTSGGYNYSYKRNGTLLTGFPINHG